MPTYRINGMPVHMRGTKLPPACVAKVPGQSILSCMAPSAYLCDGKLGDGSTCDRPLCEAHATQIGADAHLCPTCMAERQKSQYSCFSCDHVGGSFYREHVGLTTWFIGHIDGQAHYACEDCKDQLHDSHEVTEQAQA